MKKIININLSGRVIPIEDTAYESLQRYIESLRRYFAQEEGRDEIINDIESRIAELMNDKIKKGSNVVTDADIEEIINSMGRVEDFEPAGAETAASASGQTTAQETASSTSKTKRPKGRLFRDTSDKLLGGVCSGIASYMNVDPAIVRLLFAIITFGGFGMGIPVYILLWIILPAKELDTYIGKRLFRNPDDKVISGVAGGVAAYFNKPSWIIRLIFAGPLILNIFFGVLNGLFVTFHRDLFPNLFIGSFSGTFILTYIILWIVLPEAKSPFEKMEMRGEKVDVNSIRQNVQEAKFDFKTRMEGFGQEVKDVAQNMSTKATDFMNTQGKAWTNEVRSSAQPARRGLGHIIGILFKAFFIIIAGGIAIALFIAVMAIIFGGVAWWPINNFLWTSPLQQTLAWGSLIFFVAVPLVGFMTWLVRRVVGVRSRNRYLGWTFSGLWVFGWICVILFAASVAKDFRVHQTAESELTEARNIRNTLLVQVSEPEVRSNGEAWWFDHEDASWQITDEQIKYNQVKIRVDKSEDSFFHVRIVKHSQGQNNRDAQNRASDIVFNASLRDSVLDLGSGLSVLRHSKFRGQYVIVDIQVPVGKSIQFSESLADAYDSWSVRTQDRSYRKWSRRNSNSDWEDDSYFNWEPGVTYVMTKEGELADPTKKPVVEEQNQRPSNRDSLRRVIEERERQNERDREKLDRGTDVPDSNSNESTTQRRTKNNGTDHSAYGMISPLII